MIPRRLQIRTLLSELEDYRLFTSILLTILVGAGVIYIETGRSRQMDLVLEERAYWKFGTDKLRGDVQTLQEKNERLMDQALVLNKKWVAFHARYSSMKIHRLQSQVKELTRQLKEAPVGRDITSQDGDGEINLNCRKSGRGAA